MMFKKIFILAILVGLSSAAFSQSFLKKLQKKAEDAGSDLLVKKSSQKAEAAIDGKGKKETSKKEVVKEEDKDDDNSSSSSEETKAKPEKNKVKSYSKFDFVPGDKLIFSENFDQDVVGEFPLKWFTKSGGEVVTVEDVPGKWVMLSAGSLLSPIVKIPENFTYEFDVLLNLPTKTSAVYPSLDFEIFDRGDKIKRVSDGYTVKNLIHFNTDFHQDYAVVQLTSKENNAAKLNSDRITVRNFKRKYGTVMHVAISVQKERLRLWFDEEKILDLPAAVALPHDFNQFLVTGAKTGEGDPAFYFSNFKLAAGSPDTRSKLLTEGRFVTNGILFDTNSDKIKPQSYGVIKDIANILKDNEDVRIQIIGHTDGDGAADANLSLSKRRAESVKKALVNDFGISESSIDTDGKGASKPIADNKTSLGKAQNRRVEFVKL